MALLLPPQRRQGPLGGMLSTEIVASFAHTSAKSTVQLRVVPTIAPPAPALPATLAKPPFPPCPRGLRNNWQPCSSVDSTRRLARGFGGGVLYWQGLELACKGWFAEAGKRAWLARAVPSPSPLGLRGMLCALLLSPVQPFASSVLSSHLLCPLLSSLLPFRISFLQHPSPSRVPK